MAYADWTFSINGAFTSSLQTTSQIEGVSSVRFIHAATNPDVAVAGKTSGANVTTGKIRTLLKASGTNITTGVFGMMQSAIGYNSNAYWAGFSANDSCATIKLVKGQISDVNAATNVLSSIAHGISGGFVADTIYAIEIKWQRDVSSGQMVLTVAVDPNVVTNPLTYDFSTLATKITYTDSSSPYSTAVSSGIGAASNGNGAYVYYDVSQIYV